MIKILAALENYGDHRQPGSEEFSSEVVRAELRVAAALLNDVLMEEYFLEQATFDPPPAQD